MSHYITYILTNKTKILATLRTIVIICSILNVVSYYYYFLNN